MTHPRRLPTSTRDGGPSPPGKEDGRLGPSTRSAPGDDGWRRERRRSVVVARTVVDTAAPPLSRDRLLGNLCETPSASPPSANPTRRRASAPKGLGPARVAGAPGIADASGSGDVPPDEPPESSRSFAECRLGARRPPEGGRAQGGGAKGRGGGAPSRPPPKLGNPLGRAVDRAISWVGGAPAPERRKQWKHRAGSLPPAGGWPSPAARDLPRRRRSTGGRGAGLSAATAGGAKISPTSSPTSTSTSRRVSMVQIDNDDGCGGCAGQDEGLGTDKNLFLQRLDETAREKFTLGTSHFDRGLFVGARELFAQVLRILPSLEGEGTQSDRREVEQRIRETRRYLADIEIELMVGGSDEGQGVRSAAKECGSSARLTASPRLARSREEKSDGKKVTTSHKISELPTSPSERPGPVSQLAILANISQKSSASSPSTSQKSSASPPLEPSMGPVAWADKTVSSGFLHKLDGAAREKFALGASRFEKCLYEEARELFEEVLRILPILNGEEGAPLFGRDHDRLMGEAERYLVNIEMIEVELKIGSTDERRGVEGVTTDRGTSAHRVTSQSSEGRDKPLRKQVATDRKLTALLLPQPDQPDRAGGLALLVGSSQDSLPSPISNLSTGPNPTDTQAAAAACASVGVVEPPRRATAKMDKPTMTTRARFAAAREAQRDAPGPPRRTSSCAPRLLPPPLGGRPRRWSSCTPQLQLGDGSGWAAKPSRPAQGQERGERPRWLSSCAPRPSQPSLGEGPRRSSYAPRSSPLPSGAGSGRAARPSGPAPGREPEARGMLETPIPDVRRRSAVTTVSSLTGTIMTEQALPPPEELSRSRLAPARARSQTTLISALTMPTLATSPEEATPPKKPGENDSRVPPSAENAMQSPRPSPNGRGLLSIVGAAASHDSGASSTDIAVFPSQQMTISSLTLSPTSEQDTRDPRKQCLGRRAPSFALSATSKGDPKAASMPVLAKTVSASSDDAPTEGARIRWMEEAVGASPDITRHRRGSLQQAALVQMAAPTVGHSNQAPHRGGKRQPSGELSSSSPERGQAWGSEPAEAEGGSTLPPPPRGRGALIALSNAIESHGDPGLNASAGSLESYSLPAGYDCLDSDSESGSFDAEDEVASAILSTAESITRRTDARPEQISVVSWFGSSVASGVSSMADSTSFCAYRQREMSGTNVPAPPDWRNKSFNEGTVFTTALASIGELSLDNEAEGLSSVASHCREGGDDHPTDDTLPDKSQTPSEFHGDNPTSAPTGPSTGDPFETGVRHVSSGNPSEAKPSLLSALQDQMDSYRSGGNPILATILENMGDTAVELGRGEEAHIYYFLAVRSLRAMLPGNNKEGKANSSAEEARARIYVAMGDLHIRSGQHSRALKYYTKSKSIWIKLYGEGNKHVAKSAQRIAVVQEELAAAATADH